MDGSGTRKFMSVPSHDKLAVAPAPAGLGMIEPALKNGIGVTLGRFAEGRLGWAAAFLGGAVVLFIALALIVSLQGARTDALAAAGSAAADFARVLTAGVAGSMEAADAALAAAAAATAEAVADGAPPAVRLDALFRNRLSASTVLRQIVVVDSAGNVLYDSGGASAGGRFPVEKYLSDPTGAHGSPMIGAAENRRFLGGPQTPAHRLIPAVRRIDAADGRLVGYVLGALNPLHFLSLAGTSELGNDVRVALYRYDGAPLAGGDGEPLSASVVEALRRREEPGVRMEVMSDGVERIVGRRVAPARPLVVEVGVAKTAALAGWRGTLADLAAPVAGAGLAVMALTAALIRVMRRRSRELAVMALGDQALRRVPGGVAIVDVARSGRPLIYVNPALADIVGATVEQLLDDRGDASPYVKGLSDGRSLLRAVVCAEEREAAIPRRLPFLRDDRTVWAEIAVSRVVFDDGATYGVATMRDVTDQAVAEQELLHILEEVAQLHDEQERFSEVLAHHMQEQVSRIVACSQSLQREPEPPPSGADAARADAARAVERSGRRLETLLRDVRLYLSAGADLQVRGAAAADVALSQALERLRPRIGATGAQILRAPLPDVGMNLYALTETFHALLDNALTYRAANRPPVVSVDALRNDDGQWVLRIEDNGVGIEEAFQEKIFRAFERRDRRSDDADLNRPAESVGDDRDSGGAGIGLALARKLAERAGGRLWVESTPGRGSRFQLALPAAVQPQPPETTPS